MKSKNTEKKKAVVIEIQLLSIPQIATILGISERKTWLLIHSGELESVMIGRLRRVPKKELERYIAENTVKIA
jgi:excisionase family DNA binding protein